MSSNYACEHTRGGRIYLKVVATTVELAEEVAIDNRLVANLEGKPEGPATAAN